MVLAERNTRYRASTEAVLGFAWDAEAFRADDVIAALGVTRSTTLAALDTLIEVGMIRELPSAGAEEGYRMGRPARRFELNDGAGVVVGLDAGNRRFRAIVADLSGRALAEEHLDVRGFHDAAEVPYPDRDPEERRVAAFAVIDAALSRAGVARGAVVGVGVGVPAPVDAEGFSPTHPRGFWQYMNADLQAALAVEFPGVRVENDAALAAVAERGLGEAQGCDDFVAMLVGRRLGSGVYLDGRLIRGARGGVGELEGLAYVADVGGTWGMGDLAEKWARERLESGLIPTGHPWGSPMPSAEELLAQASLSDPVTRPLLEELGLRLGRICSVVARFYDPARIVVCGAVAGALGEVIAIARAEVRRSAELPPPEIVTSRLGGDVVSLGAVLAARERARGLVSPLLSDRQARGPEDDSARSS